MEPGNVIAPQNGSETPEQLPSTPPVTPAEPIAAPPTAPLPAPQATTSVQPAVPEPPQPQPAAEPTAWESPASDTPSVYANDQLPDSLSWTASEFIEHQKTAGWYAGVAIVGVIVAALAYLITRDKISTGIILLAALAFGLYAARKPRTQQYSIDPSGIQIGQRVHPFANFKVFSVVEEGAVVSIVLMPLKRFMPPLTIYVAPEMEAQVIDFLSQILPLEEHKPDAVDSLLRRIRF